MARPLVDGVAQPEHGYILGAVLADGGYAGEEAGAGVAGGPHGEDFVGEERKVVAEASVAEAVVVGMAIDHAGHDGAAGIVGGLRGRAFGSADVGGAAHGGNGGAFEEDGAVVDGSAALGVDDAVGGENGVGRCGGHGWGASFVVR